MLNKYTFNIFFYPFIKKNYLKKNALKNYHFIKFIKIFY